jgi:hypothetical protein
MSKSVAISAHGLKFEDALKRMLNTPPPPSSKKIRQKAKKKRTG